MFQKIRPASRCGHFFGYFLSLRGLLTRQSVQIILAFFCVFEFYQTNITPFSKSNLNPRKRGISRFPGLRYSSSIANSNSSVQDRMGYNLIKIREILICLRVQLEDKCLNFPIRNTKKENNGKNIGPLSKLFPRLILFDHMIIVSLWKQK